MKRRLFVIALLAAFVTTFIGFTHPLSVYAACRTITGSYLSTTPPAPMQTFSVSVGDVVTATNTAAGPGITGVTVQMNVNGSLFSNGAGAPNTATETSTPATVNGTGTVLFANVANVGTPVTMNWTISIGVGCGNGVTQLTFDDGRVNSHDGQETAAVYCEDDGGVSVWAVYQSQGYFAFTVTSDELDEIPEFPEHNTLIKSGLGVALYRLTSGELQINATNDYVFTWDGCDA